MKKISVLCVLLLVMAGCGSDDCSCTSTSGFDGSEQDIRDLIGSDLYDNMTDLGLIVHTGNEPPNIEGKYHVNPLTLQATTVLNDYPVGSAASDGYMTFENQDNTNLVIDYSYIENILWPNTTAVTESTVGTGAMITGNGNYFTIFIDCQSTIEGDIADSIMVVSGKMTSTGIKDLQISTFMKNNHGSTNFIPNNTGRLLYDGDNFSEKE